MVGGRDGEASARALAEQWKVEYLEAAAITVDPRAIPLLAPADARRLRAVPLALRGSGGLLAVAAPSEERFAAVRERTGPATQFAVVSEQTLDALLVSRLFAERQPGPTPAPPTTPARLAPQSEPATDTGELDRTRGALRATKEQLAAANAELDQSRERIRALEARLQKVARLLLPSEEHVNS